jgi:hypothetical protein
MEPELLMAVEMRRAAQEMIRNPQPQIKTYLLRLEEG